MRSSSKERPLVSPGNAPMDSNQTIQVSYVPHRQVEHFLRAHAQHVFALIDYGRPIPSNIDQNLLTVSVEMEQLNDSGVSEVWTSSVPVSNDQVNGIKVVRNEDVVFGYIQGAGADGGGLEEETEKLYARVFATLSALGDYHLYRMWNYFSAINEEKEELERYQQFCIGRHRAFSEYYKEFREALPAASAVGTSSGPFHLYFLAGKAKGSHIENPRQISAYDYPRVYGPKSPSFARATSITLPSRSFVFIAGTASIVGHATQHQNDCVKQTQETLLNLESLKEHVMKLHRGEWNADLSLNLLKVYIRHPGHMDLVKRIISGAGDPPVPTLYLHGEMCRKNLLVEIEALYTHHHSP